MDKDTILELRNQAIENVSSKRLLKDGQTERVWHQDVFDVEFARLVLENAEKLKGVNMYSFKKDDRVVCTDASGWAVGRLEVGKIYTVLFAPSPYTVVLKDNHLQPEGGHYNTRFKLAEPDVVEPKQQVIHCNNQSVRSLGIKGSTWVLTKVKDSRYVGVQYSICSHKDNYCKKVGVTVAKQMKMHEVLKTELPGFIALSCTVLNCLSPSESQIYQTVVRLD